MTLDPNRFIKLPPKADNIQQNISATDINIIQDIQEQSQRILFQIRDDNFKQDCQMVLEHHPAVNILWIDLFKNDDRIDLYSSYEVIFDENERAVILNPDSSVLTGFVYSKPYINPSKLPVNDIILLTKYYTPQGTLVKFQISNNGIDYFDIDPSSNPLKHISTDGNTLIIRAELSRSALTNSPRIESWALLWWDPTIGIIALPDGSVIGMPLGEGTIEIDPEQPPDDSDDGQVITVKETADAIKLGRPQDGSWSDGVATWTPDTFVANALDDLNEVVLSLAPENAEPMTKSLFGGPTKYTGKLPKDLTSDKWYKDGRVPGQIVNDVVLTSKGIWTIPTFNFADTGLICLYLDDTKVAAIDLGANFNEDNRNGEQDLTTYNLTGDGSPLFEGAATFTGGVFKILWVKKYNFKKWQIASAQIELDTNIGDGIHTIQVKRELVVQQEGDIYQMRIDTDNTPIVVSTLPTIVEHSILGRYLSGVKYYTIGDKFNISYKADNVFKSIYHSSQVGTIEMPGLNTRIQNPQSIPGIADVFEVSEIVELDKINVVSEDALVTVTVQDPYGNKDIKKTSSNGILVTTYGNRSNDTQEYFCDEIYRLPLNFNFEVTNNAIKNQWDSTLALINSNAQCYLTGLIYPVKDFVSNLPENVVNYSSFTGNQQYCRAFAAASGKSSVVMTLEGITNGLGQIGQGDINIEIKLPNLSGWGDALKPYDSSAGKSQDGWGMLSGSVSYSGGKATLTATFGGLSTVDCGGRIYVRVTLRNNSRIITALKAGW